MLSLCKLHFVFLRALKIYDGKNRIPAVDEFTLNALNENLSIMAIDSFTNKLLGKRSR